MSQFAINKNGITNDVGAELFAAFVKGLLPTNGIINAFDNLACARVNDNLVRLSPGLYNMSGFVMGVKPDTTADLAVDSGTGGYNRIDLVIAEFVKNGGGSGIDTSQIRILKGTSTTGTPVDPILTQEDINGTGITRQEALYRLTITGTVMSTPVRMAAVLGNLDTYFPDAGDVAIADAGGYFNGTDAEAVTQEIGASLAQISTLDNLVLRDILRIKMRQTGLNIDPNAWSDTLEDDSGINESLSDYDGVSAGVLTAKKYSTYYNADALPQNSTPVWAADGTNGTESVSNGILTITSGTGTSDVRGYRRESGNVVANNIKELNIKCKVTDGASQYDGGLRLKIGDGTKLAGVILTSSGSVKYYNSSAALNTLSSGHDFTNSYANVKMKVSSTTGLEVFVNGVSVGTVAYSNLMAFATNSISFDVMAVSGISATALIDYVKYTLDNSAVAGDSTVVWDAQTSSGTLTDAVVEAIETLGTGSITYYISRDGGTTFMACTLDAVTDISAQPSGTSIVLKAVISGNAELLAVAWGGQA